MTTIVAKELPHKVGTAEIANAELKNIAMQFMENFTALGGQVADLQQAAIELQKAAATGSSSSGGGGGSGGGSVPSEITAAVSAAQTAAGAARLNAATATAAKDAAAVSATAAAASAARAESFETFARSFPILGVANLNIPMSAIVRVTSASYDIEATFLNGHTNTINKSNIYLEDGVHARVTASKNLEVGGMETLRMNGVSGVSTLTVHNYTPAVLVFVKIYPAEQQSEGGD